MPTVLNNATNADLHDVYRQVENAELMAAGLRGRVAFLEKQVADLRDLVLAVRNELRSA